MKTTAYNLKAKLGIFILSLMVVLALSMGTSNAANKAGSVKATNVSGYEYVNSNTVKVFFDKTLDVTTVKEQFKIKAVGGTEIAISNISTDIGGGWSNPKAAQGTTVTLTTASNLNTATDYEITVSSTVRMGGKFFLTVGNYLQHEDVSFEIRTPNIDGSYDNATIKLQPILKNTVGESNNAAVISNIPLNPATLNLSNVKLQKSLDKGVTYSDVPMNTTYTASAPVGAECYSAQINDAGTCIFLPMGIGGKTTPAYNFTSKTAYKLIIPGASAVGNTVNTPTTTGSITEFKTGEAIAAATGETILNVIPGTVSSNSVGLSWTNLKATDSGEAPSGYKVYYSTNPYFNFIASTDVVTVDILTDTSSCTVTGLNPGATYYFRVVSLNTVDPGEIPQEGGLSPYTIQVTNP